MIQAKIDPKYEVVKKLREGGMGAIFLVRHRLLDELRVIKVLRSQVADDADLKERFQREARTAIQLRHPNIAQLYDFSIDEDGTAYIVLEYIDGITLEEFGRQPEARDLHLTLGIAQQALRALGYLHRKGFVHRDIAPDNLMLTRDVDGAPLVKLIDLGIVKVLRGEGRQTATSIYLGKPKYSSPEQLTRPDIDARSDLYSFGVMLYELVTGVYPIQGHDLPSLITGHLHREPLDFAISDPHGRVPEPLRQLIGSALAKDPGARPPSAEAFAEQLARIQAELEGVPHPAARTLAERAREGARRERERSLEEFRQAVEGELARSAFAEARELLAQAVERLGHDTKLAELQREVDERERARRSEIARLARLDELADRAERALEEGNLAEALSKVFEIVSHDPRHTRAAELERKIEALKREREEQLASQPTQATAVIERTAGGTPRGASTRPERLPLQPFRKVETVEPDLAPGATREPRRRGWILALGVTGLLAVLAGGVFLFLAVRGERPTEPAASAGSTGSDGASTAPEPSPEDALRQAQQALSRGELEDASRWARIALQGDSAERDGYFPQVVYGLALARLGRCEEAEALFRASETRGIAPRDPLWSEVVLVRGQCLGRTAAPVAADPPFAEKLEELESHLVRLYRQIAELRKLKTGPAVDALWRQESELPERERRVQDLLDEAERVLAIARSRRDFDQLFEAEDRLADASAELKRLLARAAEAAGRAGSPGPPP